MRVEIVDHLPQLNVPSDAKARRMYDDDLHELGKYPQVYVKISQVLRRVNGSVPEDLGFYRSRIDELSGIFGEDRLLYGSDWPLAPLPVYRSFIARVIPEVYHALLFEENARVLFGI